MKKAEMKVFVRNFGGISREDASIAGGKGASLGEMTNAGIPVPPGFVILSDAFEKFINETGVNVEIDAALDSVNHEEMHTVENASEKIRALILAAEMPEEIAAEVLKNFKKLKASYVAVRSSATAEDSASAAWAGQLDSYLNTTEKNLLENVKKCWASLFTPRAIFYRFEKGLHKQKISVAVVVQKMAQSEVSGIAFSVHPVTEDYNQLIIEASYGLGEAIVSGQVTPDSYVVEKREKNIVERMVQEKTRGLFRNINGGNEWRDIEVLKSEKQALTDKQIFDLSDLIIKIEDHYGFPVDVEWAFENGKFYIVQSRPITTLTGKNKYLYTEQSIPVEGWEIMKSSGSPLVLGFNMDSWVKVSVERYGNFAPLKELLLYTKDEGNIAVIGIRKDDYISSASYLYKNRKRLESIFDDFMNDERAFLEYVNLLKQNSSAIKNNYRIFMERYDALYSSGIMFDGFLLYSDTIINNIRKKYPNDKNENIDTLIKTPELHFAQREEMELYRIALSNASKRKHMLDLHREKFHWILNNYKHVSKLPISFFEERLNLILKQFTKEEILKKIQESEEYLENHKQEVILIRQKNQIEEKDIDSLLLLGKVASFMDRRKACNLLGNFWIGKYIELISEEFGFNLHDVLQLLPYEFQSLVKKKKKFKDFDFATRKKEFGISYKQGVLRYYENEKLIPVKMVLLGNKVPLTKIINGTTVYKGIIRGRVKKLDFPTQKEFKEGEILVTSMTRPDFVQLMKKAAAIITDEGGITSHAAIVSRELKKPCIIGTKIATQVLHDGDLVEVDANEGVVRILEKSRDDKKEEEEMTSYPHRDVESIDQIERLKGYDIKFEASRRMHNYVVYSIAHSQSRPDLFYFGDMGLIAVHEENDMDSNFFAKRKNEEFVFFDKPNKISGLLQEAEKLIDSTYRSVKPLLDLNIQSNSKEKIWDRMNIFYTAFENFMHVATFIRVIDQYTASILKIDLSDEELAILGAPLEKSFSMKEEYEILKLTQVLKKDQINLDEAASLLASKYGFLSCGYYNELPRTEKEYSKLLEERGRDTESKNHLQKYNDNWQEFLSKRKKIFDSLNRKQKIFAENAARAALIRDLNKARSSELIYLVESTFDVISKKTQYSNSQLKSFIPKEIKELLFDKRIMPGNIPRTYIGFPNEFYVIKGLAFQIPVNKQDGAVLRGRFAFRGKMRGNVCVVKDTSEFVKVKQGDILVVYNTTPDYVPLLRKVGGIIAEEGGITAHVSVISREFGIPSIVGIKNALTLLKDGDLVEVDANEGIIRIINEE